MLRSGVNFFLPLGVSQCYVRGLIFLRFGVTFLLFAV